jgi:hypothetical protein
VMEANAWPLTRIMRHHLALHCASHWHSAKDIAVADVAVAEQQTTDAFEQKRAYVREHTNAVDVSCARIHKVRCHDCLML